VEEARSAAREIVKRIEKRGEEASRVLASITTRAITSARFAFLDTDDEIEVKGAPLPQVNVARFDVDLDDDEESEEGLQATLAALQEQAKAAGVL
jgi:hypothetical protein